MNHQRLTQVAPFKNRAISAVGAAIMLIVGLAMLFGGATEGFGRLWVAAMALVLPILAFAVLRTSVLPAARDWRRVTLDGKSAWAKRLGGSGAAASGALVCLLMSVVFTDFAFDLGFPMPGLLSLLPALLTLVVGLEILRIWLRRPELRIGAEILELRGTGIDARLAWSDVSEVRLVTEGPQRWWSLAMLARSAEAPSYTFKVSRFLLPTDRVPVPPGLHVRTSLVPDAIGLEELLQQLHRMTPLERQAFIDRELPEV